ncbi:MAG: type II secretion system protein GspG [Halioglobus sp.]|nr:type II secretion system protein GspG [Halioglobus sp.]|tara:strand:- start:152 stop:589 length:438 start_codon:yes stop_codon:yes gene_type:complete
MGQSIAHRLSPRRQHGFTLIELLVVLVILGLLAGLVGPNIINQLGGAKTDTALVQIKQLEQALEMYKLDVGRYPTNSEGLEALVQKPGDADGWNGPYLKSGVPRDPWKRDYHYAYPGSRADVDIYSLGQDGAEGGEGEDADVGNW